VLSCRGKSLGTRELPDWPNEGTCDWKEMRKSSGLDLWSADHHGYLRGGPRAKAIFLFFKDINTQTDKF